MQRPAPAPRRCSGPGLVRAHVSTGGLNHRNKTPKTHFH